MTSDHKVRFRVVIVETNVYVAMVEANTKTGAHRRALEQHGNRTLEYDIGYTTPPTVTDVMEVCS